ncbi:MAG TPA: oligosaccharide flippase family protein [Thermoanaerobaculia bacterium]|nr:oligosaccharide flippase family protein [Thermoanaerobaculia bacterium]
MSSSLASLAARGRAWLSGEGVVSVLSRGSVGSLVANGLAALIGVASHMVLARLLGVASFGHYSYVWTVASLLVIVGTLGFDTAQVRFVAAYRVAERWPALAGLLRFGNRLVLAAATAVAALAALGVWAFGQGLDPELRLTLWAGFLALPGMALLGLQGAVLQGLRRVVLSKIPDVLLRPLLAVGFTGLALLVLGSVRAPGAMLATGLALLVALALGQLLVARNLPPAVRAAAPEHDGGEWLRVSLPLLLVAGMRLLMTQTDVLLLGALVGTREAGIYTAAARLGQLITFGQNAANGIAAPLISELHTQEDRAGLQRIVTLTSWGATVWALGATLALLAAGPWLLERWGPEFRTALTALVILSAGQVVNALSGPVGYLLNMTGHQGVNARILAWTVGLNFLLAAPAILWLGMNGAALVTALMTAVKNIWTWVEVRRRLELNSSVFRLGKAAP